MIKYNNSKHLGRYFLNRAVVSKLDKTKFPQKMYFYKNKVQIKFRGKNAIMSDWYSANSIFAK